MRTATEPIRVLHVVHSLGAGGMENGVVNVIRGLQGPGFVFRVACLTVAGPFKERLPDDVDVVELHKPAGLSPRMMLRLNRCLSGFRPDVIHTHNWAPLIYGVLARRLAGCGRVLHGEHAQLTPAELLPRRLRARRWLYRLVERVHTVSHAQRQELLGLGFAASKIEAVINGVNVQKFMPASDPAAAKAKLGLPGDATVIGMVARFGPFKRHLELVSAFEELANMHPEARLLLVGGGGELEQAVIDRVASSPCRDRIKLAGFMADPSPAYQAMDLLLVPSLNEGLSNAALEAMATGVPVLAHDACGNAELVGHDSPAGWVRPLETVDAIREAICDLLLKRKLLAEAGHRARLRAMDRFGLDSMIEGYGTLYRTVAGHGVK